MTYTRREERMREVLIPQGPVASARATPLSSYQRRLIGFLSVATFFEGYDFMALAQILPNLRAEMGLSPGQGSALVGVINIGTVLAYLLVRKADRWGRRRVLSLTIAGYTVCSLLTGLSSGPISFALCQLCARAFLIGEWAIAAVYAAEEYPADRRGLVIGLIQGCASLGAITCSGVVPLLLRTTPGWRSIYFIGALPLIAIAIARRDLRETSRFAQQASAAAGQQHPLTRILRSPYRARVLHLALIWALTYVCTQSAISFWKEFALAERGMTDGQVGASMSLAALVALPLVFAAGKLLDAAGRRRAAAVIFTVTALGVLGAFRLTSRPGLTAALIASIFGASAVLPVLNAFTAELFPTELRGDAFAWSNNLLGRSGAVLGPIAVGALATRVGWGPAVALTAVLPLLALALIWLLLPETGGKELEESSAL